MRVSVRVCVCVNRGTVMGCGMSGRGLAQLRAKCALVSTADHELCTAACSSWPLTNAPNARTGTDALLSERGASKSTSALAPSRIEGPAAGLSTFPGCFIACPPPLLHCLLLHCLPPTTASLPAPHHCFIACCFIACCFIAPLLLFIACPPPL